MTNVANDTGAGKYAFENESKDMSNIDFDNPNEESMQLLEESWRRFCGSIGLKEIPDIRAALAAYDAAHPPKPRRHWLVRPFVAVYDWFARCLL